MITIIALSCIIAQTAIAIYTFNILRLKDDFEHFLNVILAILFFHLGTKLFILTVLKNSFLYNHNATGFGLSYGPLIYMTVRVFLQQKLNIKLIFLHMLPFCFFTLLYFTGSAFYILHAIPGSFITSYASWYHWLVVSSQLIYPLAALRILNKAAVRPDRANTTGTKLLRWMTYIMLGGVLLGLAVAVVRVIRTGLYDFDLRLIPYICFVPLPILILRYKIKTVVLPAAGPVEESAVADAALPKQRQYKKSALDDQMMDEYEIALKRFMEKSKIYLEAGISLEELSEKARIPKHHLTQLLNERLEKNFYVFINEYRINEAIERLKDPQADVSILSLAYDCGFNSKSSFNNYFKKVTNLTPSAYRKVMVSELAEETQLPA